MKPTDVFVTVAWLLFAIAVTFVSLYALGLSVGLGFATAQAIMGVG